MKNIMTFQFD
jgi:hypothetical protein